MLHTFDALECVCACAEAGGMTVDDSDCARVPEDIVQRSNGVLFPRTVETLHITSRRISDTHIWPSGRGAPMWQACTGHPPLAHAVRRRRPSRFVHGRRFLTCVLARPLAVWANDIADCTNRRPVSVTSGSRSATSNSPCTVPVQSLYSPGTVPAGICGENPQSLYFGLMGVEDTSSSPEDSQ